MANTVAGILLVGTHASRPAGNAVSDGTIYSCTTHSLIYQSNYAGNSWSTWATLTGTGFANPMTNKGEMIQGDTGGSASALATGTAGQLLASGGAGAFNSWISLASGTVSRTAGDLTFTSTTFADVTGMSITLTTGARRCLIVVSAQTAHSQSTFSTTLDIDIDGSRQGTTTWGLVRMQAAGAGNRQNGSFSFITAALTAASHTFKLQAATDGSTATVCASDPPLKMAVMELAS